MKLNKKEIKTTITEVINSSGFLLIEILFRGVEKQPVIEVFIDSKVGVTANECAVISRTLEELFDKEVLIDSKYRLDVSSPGIDRPLKYYEQFPKNTGRKFKVKFSNGEETNSFEGKLESAENNELVFLVKGEKIKLKYDQLISAKVLVSF